MATKAKTHEGSINVSGVEETTLERVNTGILQVSLSLIIMMSGLVGLWAIASLISAIARSGGLGALFRGWLTAVTGM